MEQRNNLGKYRGKTVDGYNHWVYGSLVNNLWTKVDGGNAVTEIITGISQEGDCWEDVIYETIVEVDPETVGRYLDLKDSDGVEAWTGQARRYRCRNFEVKDHDWRVVLDSFEDTITVDEDVIFDSALVSELLTDKQ